MVSRNDGEDGQINCECENKVHIGHNRLLLNTGGNTKKEDSAMKLHVDYPQFTICSEYKN